jgi:hypothetical protein
MKIMTYIFACILIICLSVACYGKNNVEEYSINLMWINRTLIKEQTYINNANNSEELKEKLLRPALEWKKANPDADVNIWYDSKYTTHKALERTIDVLISNCMEYSNIAINFRDVREIPIVMDNSDAFSHQLPIYFRVDLLKAIIVVDEIERGKKDASIFSDLEVGDKRPNQDRMDKKELFGSDETLANYIKDGLIVNIATLRENQFLQLMNNKEMIHAIKHVIINANLMRAVTALNFKYRNKNRYFLKALTSMSVFVDTVEKVFSYYIAITTPNFKIMVRPDIVQKNSSENDQWIEYIPKKHGYQVFGQINDGNINAYVNNEKIIIVRTYIEKAHNIADIFDYEPANKEFKKRFMRDVDVRRNLRFDHEDRVEEGVPTNTDTGIYSCTFME